MTPLAPPRLTTALGGGGFVLASLWPLSTLIDVTFSSSVLLQLASWLVLTLATGVLAFGVPGERDIVGGSTLGRAALFVYGIHHLVLTLSNTLGPVVDSPGAFISGYLGLTLGIAGWLASAVAAMVIVRARVLHGFARWVLVPLVVVDGAQFVLLFALPALVSTSSTGSQSVPQELLAASSDLSYLSSVLLAAAGVAFALNGRSAAIRRGLQLLNEKW